MRRRLLQTRHGAAEPWLLQPVARKLFRKSNPWPLNDGGAAFDLAVACCLANVSCWRICEVPPALNLSAFRGRPEVISVELKLVNLSVSQQRQSSGPSAVKWSSGRRNAVKT